MPAPEVLSVPGRVNLIGEHIDYHDLPVLPMAIGRRISLAFEPRTDDLIRAASPGFPARDFRLSDQSPFPPGDWGNYLKAAVKMLCARWPLRRGIDLSITANLSPAAGLSSSSALLTGVALALLKVNGISPSTSDLMELLPEGEQYVGTRGGGMDHAAVLASQAGRALFVHFNPFRFEHIPIPTGWAFIAAHSVTLAEKSGALKAEYNRRRTAGASALAKLGFPSFSAALQADVSPGAAVAFTPEERNAFAHVISEARRVEAAVRALRQDDPEAFGEILTASHASLRDQILVSNPALDELVDAALQAGALGARLTGAGFGGCVLLLCRAERRQQVCQTLVSSFYAHRPGFRPAEHLLFAEPSAGALSA